VTLAALLSPTAGFAQDRQLSTNVSASISQIYDANLFAAPSPVKPQSDQITRVGPVFTLDYRAHTLTTTARYELQAERYLEHPDLTSATAHQDAAFGVRYLPSKLLNIGVDAGYVRTQTPSELNVDSQLTFGRAPAERVSVMATASYKWSKITTLTGEYVFGKDSLIGVMSNASHRPRVGVLHSEGARDRYRVDYEFRDFETGVDGWSSSHVLTAGWTHELTKRTGVDVAAGPRLSDGSIRPEVSAAVRYRASGDSSYSLRYSSTEMTTFGEAGPIAVQRVALGAHYRAARWCALTVSPAFTTSVRGDAQVTVYAVDVESVFDLTRRLSLVGWGRAGHQHGTLSGATGVIPYRTLGVTIKIAPPHAER